MRVAVLGDIHANVRALQAALKIADEGGYDQLILLGDLLTYGIDVVETLELVGSRLSSGRTVLLRGNHDALYQDLLDGNLAYKYQLPIWIRESVEWTLNRLPLDIWSKLSFKNELISHPERQSKYKKYKERLDYCMSYYKTVVGGGRKTKKNRKEIY